MVESDLQESDVDLDDDDYNPDLEDYEAQEEIADLLAAEDSVFNTEDDEDSLDYFPGMF